MSDQYRDELVKEQLINLASDGPGMPEAARSWFMQQGPEIATALADGLEDARLGSIGHRRILHLLAHFAKEETLPAILKAFHRALARYDPIALHGAMEALAAFRTPEASNPLIALLQESNLDIVKSAAALVGYTGDLNAVEPLLRLLGSDDSSLRYSATRGLIHFDTPTVRAALEKHLESETNSGVRELILSTRTGKADNDAQ